MNATDTPIITVTTSRNGDVVVIHVAGEVDMSSVGPFANAVRAELATQPAGLVIDLLDVRFCGSSCLRVLVQARHRTQSTGTGLCVVARSATVLRPLEIAGLAELFHVHESIPEAVMELSA